MSEQGLGTVSPIAVDVVSCVTSLWWVLRGLVRKQESYLRRRDQRGKSRCDILTSNIAQLCPPWRLLAPEQGEGGKATWA